MNINKKKLITKIFSLCFLFACLGAFISCKNLIKPIKPSFQNNKDKQIKPDSFDSNSKIVKIKIDPKSFEDSKNSRIYRTVFPEAWSETKKNALYYRLAVKDSGGNLIRAISYSWSVLKTGSAYEVLNDGLSYKLQMTAYEDAIFSKKVLESDEISFTAGLSSFLSFLLKPSSTGKGSINLSVKFRNPNGDNLSTALIRNLQATLKNLDSSIVAKTWTTFNPNYDGTTGENCIGTLDFSDNAISPGKYIFTLNLLDKDDKVLGTISETIIIDPSLVSKKTLYCPVKIE